MTITFPWQDTACCYLDYMASTPVDPRVTEAIASFYQQCPGNPSSSHHVFGQRAHQAIVAASKTLAELVGTDAQAIVWTSGATEAINLALQGGMRAYAHQGHHIISFKTEHNATLKTLMALGKQGIEVSLLDVQSNGLIDMQALEAAIKPETVMISVCHVNNEIGVIQPIEAITTLAKKHGCLVHVDGAQTLGKADMYFDDWGVDFLSLSGHKAYAPQGIGALVVRQTPQRQLEPLFYGGAQQMVRSGTLPAGLIVGMGKAAALIMADQQTTRQHLAHWQTLWQDTFDRLGGVTLHGCMQQRVPHNLNIHVAGVHAESLMFALHGMAISTGSACNHVNPEPSHVIQALGWPHAHAQQALRISMGRFCTNQQIETACQHFYDTVCDLRALSPHDEEV